MHFAKKILAAGFVAVFMSACAVTGFGPSGSIFTQTTVGAYGNAIGGTKVGRSCVTSILGLVATGDGTVDTAAAGAGITNVNTINFEGFSVLGLYSELCTIVRGE